MCDGKEEKERISRWFSLRSVDPCQGVTPGVMKVSQISPAKSSCGETEYVSTPRTSLLLVSANEGCLGHDEDMSEMTKKPKARWSMKVRDRFLVCNFWPDRLWR